MRLYRTRDATTNLSGFDKVYQFAGNRSVLGISFRPDPADLRAVSLKAASQQLAPILLGAEAYLHLIDIANQTGLTLGGVTIDPTLSEDEELELSDHIARIHHGYGTGPLKAYLLELVSHAGVMIRSLTFLVETKVGRIVKVTVHYNGVLYVTDEAEALPAIDPALSLLAAYKPGYQQA